MIVRIIKAALVGATLFAVPGMAVAGTSTATGAASFNVTNQCSITGATVNLGTFTVNQTWGNVGAELGMASASGYTVGSRGVEYLTWGSVTCDNGTPYTINIKGTATNQNAITLRVNNKTAMLHPFIKKIGAIAIADNNAGITPNAGARADHTFLVSGAGTGAAQAIVGNALLALVHGGTTITVADQLAITGSYTDTLTYTLNF